MPERRPRLFVSHSSRSDPARQRLRALIAALEAGEDRVDVLHDKEVIREGLPWRDAIDGMLAQCDAAVVLVTDDALESGWVLKEATILRWRYDQEYDRANRRPGFELVPVAWAGADPAKLEANPLWRPLDLPGIQYALDDDPAALAARLKALLSPVAARLKPSPLDLIAADIVELLSAASPLRLQQAAAALGEDAVGGLHDKSRLAYAIAAWTLRQEPPALNALVDVLEHLGDTLPKQNAKDILDAVAHFWVASEAAVWLLRADHSRPGCRDLALTCRYPGQTVEHYVQRAHRPWKTPALVRLNGITGGDHVEEIADELREEMRRRFEQLRGASPEEVDARLTSTARRFFVTLPLPEDRAVVRQLQERYERVTFIFTVPPNRRLSSVPAGVEWIEPPLESKLEDEVLQDYFDATTAYG